MVKMMQFFKVELCIQLLTLIHNALLRLDYLPTQWKCAEVIIIQKSSKPEISY